jgi:hypothetical protein
MLNHASPCVPAIAVGFLMRRGASRASKTVGGEASIDASGRVCLKADRRAEALSSMGGCAVGKLSMFFTSLQT